MVILLKTVSFAIWMIIMIALIVGSRRISSAASNEVTLVLEEDDDVEMKIRRAFYNLKHRDRLIILDKISYKRAEAKLIIDRMTSRNPSIICYHHTGENF